MPEHDRLCRLRKKETCFGIGGTDWGHYLDQERCRNCGTRCDCARVREIRATTYAEAASVFARTRDQWEETRGTEEWSKRPWWAYKEGARVLTAWSENPTVIDKVLAKIAAEKAAEDSEDD